MNANNITPLRPTGPRFPQAPLPDFAERRVERYYRERVRDTWAGGNIMRGRCPGPDDLQLTSNDYLGIAAHPAVLSATEDALKCANSGLLMSGVFLHGDCPTLHLEDKLAAHMRAPGGVLCQSGWCANVGLVQVIADAETPVYIDFLAHASLWAGIQSAGARAIGIFHNNAEHLERQVLRHGPGVVLVDSVYSTTGSIAPLNEIVAICEANHCILVVDESHSLGTHGPLGEGLVVALDLADRVHFRTASLAKAFAGRAGFITCPERFREYFKFEALPAIFSSTLLAHELAALNASLDVIRNEGWRRNRLQVIAERVRSALSIQGYNLNGSNSQVVSLEAGPEAQTIRLRDALQARGIFGAIFCAPATAKNRSLMRFSLNANMTDAEVERLITACAEIRDEVGMRTWASTRRLARRSAESTTHLAA